MSTHMIVSVPIFRSDKYAWRPGRGSSDSRLARSGGGRHARDPNRTQLNSARQRLIESRVELSTSAAALLNTGLL